VISAASTESRAPGQRPQSGAASPVAPRRSRSQLPGTGRPRGPPAGAAALATADVAASPPLAARRLRHPVVRWLDSRVTSVHFPQLTIPPLVSASIPGHILPRRQSFTGPCQYASCPAPLHRSALVLQGVAYKAEGAANLLRSRCQCARRRAPPAAAAPPPTPPSRARQQRAAASWAPPHRSCRSTQKAARQPT
jgi:hypothetical protein